MNTMVREDSELNSEELKALMSLGDNFFRQGKLTKAGIMFEGVLAIDPSHLDAANMLGETYIRDGAFEKAYTHFRAHYEQNPKPKLLLGLIKAVLALGRKEEAVALLTTEIWEPSFEGPHSKIRAIAENIGYRENV